MLTLLLCNQFKCEIYLYNTEGRKPWLILYLYTDFVYTQCFPIHINYLEGLLTYISDHQVYFRT